MSQLSSVYPSAQIPRLSHRVDMCFEDFTAAGVVYMRAACVGNIRRLIDDSRMTGVFQTPCRVVRGGFFADDGILEAGFLKGFLPVVDSLNQVV